LFDDLLAVWHKPPLQKSPVQNFKIVYLQVLRHQKYKRYTDQVCLNYKFYKFGLDCSVFTASVQIPLSTNEHGVKVACGTNVSGVLTNQGRLFVAGRFNGENNEDFLEVTPPSSVLRGKFSLICFCPSST